MTPRALNRRSFLKTTATALAATAGGLCMMQAGGPGSKNISAPAGDVIDVNVTLGRWPFRRLPLDDAGLLATRLRERGVLQAWAGSFDGIFFKDVASANARLAEDCRRHGRGRFQPFGAINLALPAWEEDLRRCAQIHRMPGIRLHPTYHGWAFSDPAFARLLVLAAERRLLVQISADMEDERTQSPLARAPHADFQPLPEILRAHPSTRVLLLNWSRSIAGNLVVRLAQAGAFFDVAMVENVGGVAGLVQQISSAQVLFGSHAPLFYPASAHLKLVESALSAADEELVRLGNARKLFLAA